MGLIGGGCGGFIIIIGGLGGAIGGAIGGCVGGLKGGGAGGLDMGGMFLGVMGGGSGGFDEPGMGGRGRPIGGMGGAGIEGADFGMAGPIFSFSSSALKIYINRSWVISDLLKNIIINKQNTN